MSSEMDPRMVVRLIKRLREHTEFCLAREANTIREIGLDCETAANQIETDTAALATMQAREAELVGALREGIALLDELNKRKSSRVFYGIGQGLHAKLATVRATLVRHSNQERVR